MCSPRPAQSYTLIIYKASWLLHEDLHTVLDVNALRRLAHFATSEVVDSTLCMLCIHFRNALRKFRQFNITYRYALKTEVVEFEPSGTRMMIGMCDVRSANMIRGEMPRT